MAQPTRAFISHPRYTARFVNVVSTLCLLYFRADGFIIIIICVCGSPPVLLRLLQAYVECCSSIICIVQAVLHISGICVSHNILLTFNSSVYIYISGRTRVPQARAYVIVYLSSSPSSSLFGVRILYPVGCHHYEK